MASVEGSFSERFLQGPIQKNSARNLMEQFVTAKGIGKETEAKFSLGKEPTLIYRKDPQTGARTIRSGTPREEVFITDIPNSEGTVLWVSHDGAGFEGHASKVEDRLHAEAKAQGLVDMFTQQQPPIVEKD